MLAKLFAWGPFSVEDTISDLITLILIVCLRRMIELFCLDHLGITVGPPTTWC